MPGARDGALGPGLQGAVGEFLTCPRRALALGFSEPGPNGRPPGTGQGMSHKAVTGTSLSGEREEDR